MLSRFFTLVSIFENWNILIRVLIGIIIAKYGLGIFNPEHMKGNVTWLTDIHFPLPFFMAYLGKATELIGGVLLVLGLFTRLSCIALMINMIVIVFVMGRGLIFGDDQLPFLLLLFFMNFFIQGAGKWSLDHILLNQNKLWMKRIPKSLLSVFLIQLHICIWNTASVAQVTKTPILWTVDFSPDGRFYAIGGNDKLLRIYHSAGYELFKTYGQPATIQCVDWNRDGNLLAIAIDDKPVRLLNMKTGLFSELPETTGSRALAWNSTGELLAIGDYNGSLQIWNKAGKLIRSIKKDNMKTLSVDWHPEKDIILTGGDKIRLFDIAGNLLQSIRHRPEETIILTVKWHPGGHFFAIGDYGEKENKIESLLQFWNESGKLIKTLKGSQAEYRNIRWDKQGKFLATASDALRIWSKEGILVNSGKSSDLLWGIDWNQKNTNIITTSEKGKAVLWSTNAQLIRALK